MKINQASVANSIAFFKKDFMDRWQFDEYTCHNKPCVFFGAYESSALIQNNTSLRIVLPTNPYDLPDFNIVRNKKNLYIISPTSNLIPKDVICKDLWVEIKDYSLFKPNKLGDKIYAYIGFKNGWDLSNNIIQEIQKKIDYEIITTNHFYLKDYYNINYLKENYYDKCFLNLNFSNMCGMTTVRELGMMGRRTIMNENHYNYPCIISYKNYEDILKLINDESKKIGTVQEPINSHNIDEKWLDTEFWIN